MRTSTAAWAAALAVMSMRGPFTTAEAAPARQDEPERPRHFFPKHLKRHGYNYSSPAVESSSITPLDLDSSSVDSSSSQAPITDYSHPPPITDESTTSTHSRRSRSTTKTSPSDDDASLLASLISAGRLPETTNTVVTTTLILANKAQRKETYTITYTETSSPVPDASSSQPPIRLYSSTSVPVESSSDSHKKSKDSSKPATISSRDATTKHKPSGNLFSSILGSAQPTIPLPPSASGRAHSTDLLSSSQLAYSSHPSLRPTGHSKPSSSVVPSSSSALPSSSSVVSSSSSALPTSSSVVPSSSSALRSSSSVIPSSSSSSLALLSSSSVVPQSSSALPSSSSVPPNSSSALLYSSQALSSSSSALPSTSSALPSSSSGGLFGIPGLGSSNGILNTLASATGVIGHATKPYGSKQAHGTGVYGGSRLNHGGSSESIPATSSSGLLPNIPGTSSPEGSYTSQSSSLARIPNVLGTGTGRLLSLSEPAPTIGQSSKPATAAASSSTDTGNIIVGLSTILSDTVLPTGGVSKSSDAKPTKTGLLNTLGISGIATGIPTESLLPSSGIAGEGHHRAHGGPNSDSSTAAGIVSPVNSATGSLGSPTSQLIPSGTGAVGSLTEGVSSAVPKVTNGISGVVGTATNAAGTAVSKATDGLTGVGTATNFAGTISNIVGTASSQTTDGISAVAGTGTNVVGTVSNAVGTVTQAAETATNAVGTVTQAAGTATNAVGSITQAAGTATYAVGSTTQAAGTATNAVGSVTQAAGTVTDAAGTVTQAAGTTTNAVGSVTQAAGTVTNAAGTVTQAAGTVTTAAGSAAPTVDTTLGQGTGHASVTAPSGSYTITGGGVTLTVPIPTTSAQTSVAVTAPTGGTTTTSSPTPAGSSTKVATVPTDASATLTSQQGSLTSADTTSVTSTDSTSPSDTVSSSSEVNTTSPETGYSQSTSIALTGGTTLSLGATGSSASSVPSSTGASAVPTPSTSTTATKTTKTHHNAPQSISPTGSDTATSLTFPKTWHFAPTSTWATKSATSGISTAGQASGRVATSIPTYMPQLVQPPGGMPDAPPNSTLIQLGLNYGLNYPFVVSQPESASQIFAFLPQGIAYGLGISKHQVVMNALMPFNTAAQLNYITTLAQVYVPSQLVDTLEMSLHMPLSEIYQNPDSLVKALMHMINPTIPIIPGASLDGTSSSAWYNPAATATTSTGDGAPLGGDSGSSNHVRGSTVGIGVGAVCGAAVYAAAMVYVARRYRQKRQGHQRASSVHTSGEMSQRSGNMGALFMSGANGRGSATGSGGRGSRTSGHSSNGRSVREQGISNPIMAENSLGWN